MYRPIAEGDENMLEPAHLLSPIRNVSTVLVHSETTRTRPERFRSINLEGCHDNRSLCRPDRLLYGKSISESRSRTSDYLSVRNLLQIALAYGGVSKVDRTNRAIVYSSDGSFFGD